MYLPAQLVYIDKNERYTVIARNSSYVTNCPKTRKLISNDINEKIWKARVET